MRCWKCANQKDMQSSSQITTSRKPTLEFFTGRIALWSADQRLKYRSFVVDNVSHLYKTRTIMSDKALWKLLCSLSLHSKVLDLMEALYTDTYRCVSADGVLFELRNWCVKKLHAVGRYPCLSIDKFSMKMIHLASKSNKNPEYLNTLCYAGRQ